MDGTRGRNSSRTAGLGAADRATLAELLGRIAAAQGLAMGVHPGFADERAHPGHGDDLDVSPSADEPGHPVGGGPGRPLAGPTTDIGKAR